MHGQERGILARWVTGSLGLRRQDGTCMGRADRPVSVYARGSFRLGPERGILARRVAGSLGLMGLDGTSVGRACRPVSAHA
jgi:hypothetical protein